MKHAIAAAVLLLPVCFPALASASSADFSAPDAKAQAVIIAMLGAKYHQDKLDESMSLVAASTAAWVQVSDKEPPFLFVIVQPYCGASDCMIFGYRNSAGKWNKVYQLFGGDGLEVLDSGSKGYRDLRQYESQGEGKTLVLTSHWIDERYGDPVKSTLP